MIKELARKDRNGILLKEGDIVAEGKVGDVVWDGKGVIEKRPLGVVKVYLNVNPSSSLPPEETDCYNVSHLRAGIVKLTDKADPWMESHLGKDGLSDVYMSCYDGRFYAWDDIEIIGSIYDFPD